MLASIGTSRNAKRATIIHLLFNIIGTVIFTLLFLILPIAHIIDGSLVLPGGLGASLAAVMPKTAAGRVALIHTCFNIGTTIILLPLGNYLARLAVRIPVSYTHLVCNRVFDFSTDGKLTDRRMTYDEYLEKQKEAE